MAAAAALTLARGLAVARDEHRPGRVALAAGHFFFGATAAGFGAGSNDMASASV